MANRKKQIEAIQTKITEVAEEIELLIEELEGAYENMPESFQMGERGDTAQDRIQTLQTWLDNLNDMAEEEI